MGNFDRNPAIWGSIRLFCRYVGNVQNKKRTMLPQIAGFNAMEILQNGVFNHKTNPWLPQIEGFLI